MKTKLILIGAMIFASGCGTLTYNQEAGFLIEFPDKNTTNNVMHLAVGYHTNGNIQNILLNVTNATQVTVKDLSAAAGKSVIAKSGADELAGNRKGMLDNNAGVNARGVQTEQQLDAILKEVNKLTPRGQVAP